MVFGRKYPVNDLSFFFIAFLSKTVIFGYINCGPEKGRVGGKQNA